MEVQFQGLTDFFPLKFVEKKSAACYINNLESLDLADLKKINDFHNSSKLFSYFCFFFYFLGITKKKLRF